MPPTPHPVRQPSHKHTQCTCTRRTRATAMLSADQATKCLSEATSAGVNFCSNGRFLSHEPQCAWRPHTIRCLCATVAHITSAKLLKEISLSSVYRFFFRTWPIAQPQRTALRSGACYLTYIRPADAVWPKKAVQTSRCIGARMSRAPVTVRGRRAFECE